MLCSYMRSHECKLIKWYLYPWLLGSVAVSGDFLHIRQTNWRKRGADGFSTVVGIARVMSAGNNVHKGINKTMKLGTADEVCKNIGVDVTS